MLLLGSHEYIYPNLLPYTIDKPVENIIRQWAGGRCLVSGIRVQTGYTGYNVGPGGVSQFGQGAAICLAISVQKK